jgi:hypothetical protein
MTVVGPEIRRVFWYGEYGVLTTPEDFEATIAVVGAQRVPITNPNDGCLDLTQVASQGPRMPCTWRCGPPDSRRA